MTETFETVEQAATRARNEWENCNACRLFVVRSFPELVLKERFFIEIKNEKMEVIGTI